MLTNASNSFRARLALAFILILGMLGVQLPKPVLAATFTVTNTNDSGPGSLREAILQQFNGNTITFDPSLAGQTITLSSGLIINQDLTIDGSGLNPPVVLSGGYATRIIQTQGIADVTISDLTFTRGVSIAGGAIDMTGSSQLTLKNSTLYQNQASSSGGAISDRGNGGITIVNSTFYQNQAGASGGAISIGFGPGTIVNSTFFDNNATGDGGAITSSLDLTLIDSTLSGNTAGNGGGAIFAFQPTIKNTVIYLNQASQGGAILIPGNGRGTIVNSTITQNQASASGGAIYMHGTTQVEVFNSTFAANNAPEGSEVSAIGRADFVLYNTILACAPGNNGCIFEFGNISVGGPNSIIDTGTLESFGLGELADNGGPTQTMALLPQSLLIDAGDDLVCANSSVNNLDQRGVTRPQGSHCDIGAYEAIAITVTKTDDTNDGVCDNDCSLREAIGVVVGGETINFDPLLAGQTITLISPLVIDKNLTIDGSSLITKLNISGNNSVMIFSVNPSVTVTIKSLIIKNGKSTSNGGAISNAGTLTIIDSIFSANNAVVTPYIVGIGEGGAIYSQGVLTIINSTFNGNNASRGGAISCSGGTISITDSTYSSNNAVSDVGGDGGAIYGSCSLMVLNSTFSTNTAAHYGGAILADNDIDQSKVINSTFYGNTALISGGIANYGGLMISNSTFSNNNAPSGGAIKNGIGGVLSLRNSILANSVGGVDCIKSDGAPPIENINNLIETTGTDFESCGTPLLSSDPKLGPLGENGGSTQTMALLHGSPAINAGDDASCPATDQRGVSRPYGSHCDIGAFEYKKNGSDTTGVFRTSNGALYLKNSNVTGYADVQINYGIGGDYPVVGDWDGDGKVTIGIYRNGVFYLRNSNTIGYADWVFAFGMPGDQPVAGDWNGDGIDTIGVYRNGTFYLRNSNSTGAAEMSFSLGIPGDVGIAGDWNGDGMDTTGVFRPSNGALYLKNTNGTGFADIQINYGLPGDKPVTGDWDNDGIDTIGVYRNGTFFLRNSNTIGYADIQFDLGIPGDMPIAGNWDGLP